MRPQPKEEEALWLRPCDGGGLKQTQRNKRVNKRAIYPSQKTDSQTNSIFGEEEEEETLAILKQVQLGLQYTIPNLCSRVSLKNGLAL